MRHPHKVATILQQASIDHPTVEVSVKCRLGVDSFEFFRPFVVRDSSIRLFVVHARNAKTFWPEQLPEPPKYSYFNSLDHFGLSLMGASTVLQRLSKYSQIDHSLLVSWLGDGRGKIFLWQ